MQALKMKLKSLLKELKQYINNRWEKMLIAAVAALGSLLAGYGIKYILTKLFNKEK